MVTGQCNRSNIPRLRSQLRKKWWRSLSDALAAETDWLRFPAKWLSNWCMYVLLGSNTFASSDEFAWVQPSRGLLQRNLDSVQRPAALSAAVTGVWRHRSGAVFPDDGRQRHRHLSQVEIPLCEIYHDIRQVALSCCAWLDNGIWSDGQFSIVRFIAMQPCSAPPHDIIHRYPFWPYLALSNPANLSITV